MNPSTVVIPQIANFDPLYSFLKRGLRLTPVKVGLLILVLDLVVDGWVGFYYQGFHNDNFPASPPGLLQDYVAIVFDFVSLPILIGLYYWLPDGITKLFQRLADSGVFCKVMKFEQTINLKRGLFSSKWLFALFVVIAATLGILQMGSYIGWMNLSPMGGYIEYVPAAAYYRLPFWILGFYTFIHIAFNVLVTILTLTKAFVSTEIEIQPLNPDKSGGLGSVSDFTDMIGFGIGAIGLWITAATFYESTREIAVTQGPTYPTIAAIIVYLVCGPLFFFLPLAAAHDSMKKAKDEELRRIAKDFSKTYKEVQETSKKTERKEKFSEIDYLTKLYDIVNTFPVWPFDVKNLRRFLTIISAPVLPAIIQILLETILRK